MVAYADSSFLVSLYVKQTKSELARKVIRDELPLLLLSPFSLAETQHALRSLAFQKLLNREEMTQSLLYLENDLKEGLYQLRTLSNDQLFEAATALSNRHAADFGVRFLDTLHVASALRMNAKRFFTFDARQAKLAKAVGLQLRP